MKKYLLSILMLFILMFSLKAFALEAQWDDPNDASVGVTSYTLFWYETSITQPTSNDIFNKTTPAPATSMVLDVNMFKPNTDYTFYIMCRTQYVESDFSEAVVATPRPLTEIVPPPDKLPTVINVEKPATIILNIN